MNLAGQILLHSTIPYQDDRKKRELGASRFWKVAKISHLLATFLVHPATLNDGSDIAGAECSKAIGKEKRADFYYRTIEI